MFWRGVLSEVKNRDVEGIRIACMDGLSGFPDAVWADLSPAPRHPQGARFHEVYFIQRPEKVRAGLKAVSPCMALPSPVKKPEGRRLRISAGCGTPGTP
jgi:hypothetical protein